MRVRPSYAASPAVGSTLTRKLLAELLELRTGPHKRRSALLRIAPFNRDSGETRGKREVSTSIMGALGE